MKIYGLQKMTLLDYPGHVGCTVFLGGCDFRCPFCHNYELACAVSEPVMEEDGLYTFLDRRKGLLDAVTISGGEPCLSVGLESMMERIREKGFLVKLDTNGYHPDILKRILEKGLADYVAMDIKNSPGKYAVTAGIKKINQERILESIGLLMDGKTDYEFRTTVVRELHEENDFHEMGKMIQGAGKYFLQFFTDRDTVPFSQLHAPDAKLMERYLSIARGYVPGADIRGEA